MSATRRKTAYRIGLDTDETIFNVAVEWLFEMSNPLNPNMPFQSKERTPLERVDFTEEELTALAIANRCIHNCIERKLPMIPKPVSGSS